MERKASSTGADGDDLSGIVLGTLALRVSLAQIPLKAVRRRFMERTFLKWQPMIRCFASGFFVKPRLSKGKIGKWVEDATDPARVLRQNMLEQAFNLCTAALAGTTCLQSLARSLQLAFRECAASEGHLRVYDQFNMPLDSCMGDFTSRLPICMCSGRRFCEPA